jgi:hypothetical protein
LSRRFSLAGGCKSIAPAAAMLDFIFPVHAHPLQMPFVPP